MNRKTVEDLILSVRQSSRSYIIEHPLTSVVLALLLGITIHAFSQWLVPLIVVTAALVGLLWLFSDSEES